MGGLQRMRSRSRSAQRQRLARQLPPAPLPPYIPETGPIGGGDIFAARRASSCEAGGGAERSWASSGSPGGRFNSACGSAIGSGGDRPQQSRGDMHHGSGAQLQPMHEDNSSSSSFSGAMSRSSKYSKNARLHGRVASWDDNENRGYITSTAVATECAFTIQDVPACCQRSREALHVHLAAGAKVLFTLCYTPDGITYASEVAPIPAIDEYIFGRVKNYGANSGYGFLRPVEDSVYTHDVYFNFKDFQEGAGDIMRMRLDNALCKFNIRFTPDGKGQAKNIEVLEMPENPALDPKDGGAKDQNLTCHGVISTYKQDSGFGFIKCPKLGKDVWFPRRELPRDMIAMDLRGAVVEFDLWVQGDEKPQARNIKVADSGIPSTGKGGKTLTVNDKVAMWHAQEAARAGVLPISGDASTEAPEGSEGRPSRWT